MRVLSVALAARIEVVRDSTFRENLPVRLAIDTRDGRHGERLETALEGAPDTPMSGELCVEKFRQCCELGARPFSASDVDAMIAVIDSLESHHDVRGLARLVA